MNPKKLEKLEKQLHGMFAFRRMAAVRALAADTSPGRIPVLARALEHKDPAVREAAWEALGSGKDSVVADALIQLAIAEPEGALARRCRAARFQHTDDGMNCVFLLVTGQIDAYFAQQDDFQHVRRAYEKGDETLRANIMRVVQSGDRRFQPFFKKGAARHERGEQDIMTEIQSCLRLQDWPQLFELFLEAPMKYGYPLLEQFRNSGWEPPAAPPDADPQTKSRAEARRSLYHEALKLSAGKAVPPAAPQGHDTAEAITLEGGADGGSATTLLAALDKATPVEAIPVVAALAQQGRVDEAARKKIQESPHWPIRLAGRLTGLCPQEAFANDPVHWVREGMPLVAKAMSASLELWPSRATPQDVQQMSALPPQAFEGKLGAVRGVLRLLITSGVKAAIVEKDQAMARQQAAVVDEEE